MVSSTPIKKLMSFKGDSLYSYLKRSYRLACRIHGSAREECKDSSHICFVGQTWYCMEAARLALTMYYIAQGYDKSATK